VYSNELAVDAQDGTSFLTTYMLNKEFDYVEVVTDTTLARLYLVDMGVKYVAAHSHALSAFVSLYGHLSMKQLSALASLHSV
jgi:hypothetical protein